MAGHVGLLADLQYALVKRLGLRVLTLGVVHRREVIQALGHSLIIWAVIFFIDRDQAPVEWLASRILSLDHAHVRQVFECSRHTGMIRTEGFFFYGQRALVKLLGLRQFGLTSR